MMTFDQTLDSVMQLPFEQREKLIGIIQHRNNENRRHEIAKEAREALADFKVGKFKSQSVQDIITELRHSLNEGT